jgi:tetratricopeptide (TPR) repeat protein
MALAARLARWLLFGAALGAPAVAAQTARESLEQLLDRARAERDAALAALAPELDSLLDGIVAAAAEDKPREVDRLSERVLRLGTVAGLGLVQRLDTPESAPLPVERRAREAARLLESLLGPVLLEPLVGVIETGSERGKLRAIGVLGAWPTAAPVEGRLVELSERGRSTERIAAVAALARLGGPAAAARLTAVLRGDEAPLIEQALVEIGRHRRPELSPLVDTLLAVPERCVQYLAPLLEYFRGDPSTMTAERGLVLISLVRGRQVQGEDAVELLDDLGGFPLELRGPVGAALTELEQFPRRDVAEAASVALARLGDQGALRRLEQEYDKRVDQSRDLEDYRPVAARGRMYLRVGEYKKAERDLEKAITLDGGWGGLVEQSLYVDLARTQVRLGDLKGAAKSLETAQLSPEQRTALAQDSDFAALRASRYGAVLGG